MEIKPRNLYAVLAIFHPAIYLFTKGKGDAFIYLNWALCLGVAIAFFFMFIVRTKRRKKQIILVCWASLYP